MQPVMEGNLSAAGLKFAIVVGRFNSFITDRLLEGALDAFRRAGALEESRLHNEPNPVERNPASTSGRFLQCLLHQFQTGGLVGGQTDGRGQMESRLHRLSVPGVQHEHGFFANRCPGAFTLGEGDDDRAVADFAGDNRASRRARGQYSVAVSTARLPSPCRYLVRGRRRRR